MAIALRPALLASVSFAHIFASVFADPAFGQGAPAGPLDDITVTATRTEERAVDALASVSVTSRQELRSQQPQRLGTVISQTPGVSTQENPNDPATAINIRGLQDFGRVAVTVDGARQNFQRSGHNANGAFFLDPAFIRTIDITRGPVANIYGSGAIGGVASFETVDPRDILRPGQMFGVEYGLTGLLNRQEGLSGYGIAAARPADWVSGLVGFSLRDHAAYSAGGGGKVADSGQDLASGLAKFVLTPADGHTLKFSGQLQSYNFTNGTGTSTSPRRENTVETSNLVAKYTFARPDNDWIHFSAALYRTTTDTDQVRVSGTPAQLGQKRYFNIETTGFDVNNTSRFDLGPARLAVTYGVDGFQDKVRTADPFGNGDETTPSGERTVYGAFVQNHVKWSIIDVIGALRFDAYELSGGRTSSDGQRVSPKITVGITPIAGIQPYVTYAEGYRAPSITETLVDGLHPSPASFTFVPNPNLRPEVGKTIEAGVNVKFNDVFAQGDALRGKFAAFQNRVRDFIDGVYVDPGRPCGSGGTSCNDAYYTYENVARATLSGIEGEITYDARAWFLSAAGSMVRGDNKITNEPLQSVYPDKVALTGGLRFLDEKLVVSSRLTLVDEQRRLPAAALAANASKAYALVDATVSYEIAKDTRLFAIAENIGDVRYKRYRDGDYSPGFVGKIGLSGRFGM